MKVSELIAILQTKNQDAKVEIYFTIPSPCREYELEYDLGIASVLPSPENTVLFLSERL
jgi:hypothetical protein